jgi:hypothetical protein
VHWVRSSVVCAARWWITLAVASEREVQGLILKINEPAIYSTRYIRKPTNHVHQQVTSFSGLVVKLAVAKRLTAPNFG